MISSRGGSSLSQRIPACSHLFSFFFLIPSLSHSKGSRPSDAPPPPLCIARIVNSSQKHDKVPARVPPASVSVLQSICYCLPRHCVFVSITRSLFCFSSASEKQKLIKYGTRWSSISLNHHVIKMASLGDQLKRSQRTMSPPSDIYGPGYVNMLPLFSMYISCNYHFL